MKQKHWKVSVFNKTSETVRDDAFYTTDTEAYLVFELIDEDFAPDLATVTVYNIHGKATISAGVEIVGGIVRYEMPTDAIGHPGGWRAQAMFTKDDENYTANVVEFDVGGHLLDNEKPTFVEIENWNSFIKHAEGLVGDWERLEEIRQANEQQRELAESARQNEFEANETSRQTNELIREEAENNRQSTFETNESTRQANELIREEAEGNRQFTFEENEVGRQSEFEENELARETAESERVANEEERISKETERIESEVARKEEMEKARYSRFSNHTYNEIGERLDTIESHTFTSHIFDKSGAPGPKSLIRGNEEAGFYGFVQPHEFGEIAANPAGRKEMNGANLALAIGLTGGTAFNIDTPWMKFSRRRKIYFVPVKPIRHSATWNQIYAAGAVYGDGTADMTPPNGRAGKRLSVSGDTNSYLINNPGDGFLRPGVVFGKVGDKLVARGFVNAANNGEFTITAITDDAITVDGDLVDEASAPKASIYEKTQAVSQNRDITIGGNRYRVQLLKGASQDPLNSYSDADRDMVGPESEWNALILPMHEKAKLQNWAYKAHAGTTEDWGIGLTDADLLTHSRYGYGSYTWCQETPDEISYRRVGRGHSGASFGYHSDSWFAWAANGFRPVLRLI